MDFVRQFHHLAQFVARLERQLEVEVVAFRDDVKRQVTAGVRGAPAVCCNRCEGAFSGGHGARNLRRFSFGTRPENAIEFAGIDRLLAQERVNQAIEPVASLA